jgi:hypothetical protein
MKFPEVDLALQLESRLRKAVAHLDGSTVASHVMGVHSNCVAERGTTRCQVNCFSGSGYLLTFTESKLEIASWGRSSQVDEVVAAAAFWLERPKIATLRERFLFVDRRERDLSALRDKVLDLVAELGPEAFQLKRIYSDIVELKITKDEKSCWIGAISSDLTLDARFCWDETEQFSVAACEVADFARFVRRWLIDGVPATALAREERNLNLAEVAEYYESGRPIEGEFILSWIDIRDFYLEDWETISPTALALLDHLSGLGYDRQLRAGQSMATLVLSRSRRHGLRPEQKYVRIEFDRNGIEITLRNGDGQAPDRVVKAVEVTPEVIDILNELAASSLD